MWLGYDVKDNSTAVFAPPQRKPVDVLKIRRPPAGCTTNRLIRVPNKLIAFLKISYSSF